MNQVTRDIAAYLKISLVEALQVQDMMECDGFDFSECTNRQLYSTAKRMHSEMAFFDDCCLKAS
jgi:hypothetical protein